MRIVNGGRRTTGESFIKTTNYTSDHLYRRIVLKFSYCKRRDNNSYYSSNSIKYHNMILDLKGFTFNLLGRCFSLEEQKRKKFSNNPLNISEDMKSYIERKLIQFKVIENLMKEEDSSFILLQEVDFLFYDKYENQLKESKNSNKAVNNCQTPEWFLSAISIIKEQFLFLLERYNWECEAYDKREIAILTNTLKLDKIDKTQSIYLPSTLQNINILYTCVYKVKELPNYNITLGTLHAFFNDDYSIKLNNLINTELWQNKTENNLITIIGGDTNHPPSLSNGLLTSGDNIATNFQTDYINFHIIKKSLEEEGDSLSSFNYNNISSIKKYSKVILKDERNSNLSKAYDGFIVSKYIKLFNNIRLKCIIVSGDHQWSCDSEYNSYQNQIEQSIKVTNEHSEVIYRVK